MKTRSCIALLAPLFALSGVQLANATTAFNLTDTVGWTVGGTPSPINIADANISATVNTVVPTVSFGISNAFNQSSTGTPIHDNFPGTVATGSGGPWNFYDNYVFSLNSAAAIQSALISFTMPDGVTHDLTGISALQARIIRLDSNPNSSYTNGTFDGIVGGLLGSLPANTLVDGWVTTQTTLPGNLNYYSVLLNQQSFSSGLYALQIRGQVQTDGSIFSGGYGGTLSFTPVPLPAAVWLLASGLLAVAGAKRRRCEVAAA
jgi:hypothetical protein